jgi:hypothetical protein
MLVVTDFMSSDTSNIYFGAKLVLKLMMITKPDELILMSIQNLKFFGDLKSKNSIL